MKTKQIRHITSWLCAAALILTLIPSAFASQYSPAYFGYGGSGIGFSVQFWLSSARDRTDELTLSAYSPSGEFLSEPQAHVMAVEVGSDVKEAWRTLNGERFDGVTVTGCSVSLSGSSIEIRDTGFSMPLGKGAVFTKADFGSYDAVRCCHLDDYCADQPYPIIYYFLLEDGAGSPADPGASPSCDHANQPSGAWTYATVEATCVAEGRFCRTCKRCGCEETISTVPKTNHTWEQKTVQGTAYRVCKVCGAEEAVSAPPAQTAEDKAAYETMIALKSQYPENSRWTNDNFYEWKGGIYSGGYGCAGFAFMLSDAAFGSLPARMYKEVSFSDVRAGDILRINADSHSVIVLEVLPEGVVTAEGNVGGSVHWGGKLSRYSVETADYRITRWPEAGAAEPEPEKPAETQKPAPAAPVTPVTPVTPAPTPTPTPAAPVTPTAASPFADVPAGSYYHDAVLWALDKGVTTGVDATHFKPDATCTRGQVVTFLWRAYNKPSPSRNSSLIAKQYPSQYFTDALAWVDTRGLLHSGGLSWKSHAQCPRADVVSLLYSADANSIYW